MALTPLAGYADGVPREVEIPDMHLFAAFEQTVAAHADRPALDFYGATTTYRELADRVTAAAQVLALQGVRPGDRVAIVLPTCPQAVIAFYAVLRLGAIVVEHNPLYTADELAHNFADHGAQVAIVWDRCADLVAALDLPQRLSVLTVDLSTSLPRLKRWALALPIKKARATRAQLTAPTSVGESFDAAVRAALSRPGEPLAACPAKPGDVALLQYTGGTTGRPKAAMLTHRNLLANALQSMAWVPHLEPGREVFYGILPLFHAYGMMLCLLDAVRLGACLVLFPRFDEQAVIEAMGRRPATFLPGVPPIYDRLATAAEQGRVDLRSVRWGVSGAMPLAPALVERWERVTGGMLIEGYGMTETSPIVLGNPFSDSRRPGSVGLPFPSTEVRIVDVDDPQRTCPTGVEGELLVRGPQVFAGYWNNPQESAAILAGDGWLRTGDVAVQDESGFVTIVDRIKDVIITGGFNVYPSEVEDVLRAHPSVREVAVVGQRRADGNETLTAAVIPDTPTDFDPAALTAYARDHLAGYKTPRRIVLVDEIPLSPIGKVQRRKLRDQLEDI